jgi:hypothetical protein
MPAASKSATSTALAMKRSHNDFDPCERRMAPILVEGVMPSELLLYSKLARELEARRVARRSSDKAVTLSEAKRQYSRGKRAEVA